MGSEDSASRANKSALQCLASSSLRFSNFANSSPWNVDRLHRILQYFLRTVAHHMRTSGEAAEKLEAGSGAKLIGWATGISSISSQLSAARLVNRLYGTVDYTLGLVDALTNRSKSQTLHSRVISIIQNASLLLYAVAEVGYWIGIVAPQITPSWIDANMWSLWSCRGWLFYLLAERWDLLFGPSAPSDAKAAWNRQQVDMYNWCNLPLALTWSFENGCYIPPWLVAWAGLIGSMIGLRRAWRSFE